MANGISKKRFYSEGLRFECTGCGACCKLGGGYVYPSLEDVAFLAKHLGMGTTQFTEKYMDIHEGKYILKSNGEDCIFLKDDGCMVYEARPVQCRTFPFWSANLKSQYRWKIIAEECEGIGQGRLYTYKEIEAIKTRQSETSIGPEPGQEIND